MSNKVIVNGVDVSELIKRNTPMRGTNDNGHAFTYIYSCGSCDYILDIPQLKEVNFCPKCGQKLWWIEK